MTKSMTKKFFKVRLIADRSRNATEFMVPLQRGRKDIKPPATVADR